MAAKATWEATVAPLTEVMVATWVVLEAAHSVVTETPTGATEPTQVTIWVVRLSVVLETWTEAMVLDLPA